MKLNDDLVLLSDLFGVVWLFVDMGYLRSQHFDLFLHDLVGGLIGPIHLFEDFVDRINKDLALFRIFIDLVLTGLDLMFRNIFQLASQFSIFVLEVFQFAQKFFQLKRGVVVIAVVVG